MNDKKKLLFNLLPAFFAIIALIFAILALLNTSSNLLLSIACCSMGISYILNYYIKKYLKEKNNALNIIFGIIILVLGIIILILDIIF